MGRGSRVAGMLSLIGAVIAFALAVVFQNPVSMYTAIGVVLLLNAAVRFRMASDASTNGHHR